MHNFNTYLGTLEAQLPPYNKAYRTTYFFIKLRPELRAALINYQDLFNIKNGLIALAARLEANIKKNSGNISSSRRSDKGNQ